jgi:hypothetical protein
MLISKFKLRVDVRVIEAGAGNSDQLVRLCRYVLVPTESKHVLDKAPLKAGGFAIPAKITDEASKARTQLLKKSATPAEMLKFVKSSGLIPHSASGEAVEAIVSEQLAKAQEREDSSLYHGHTIFYQRLHNFILSLKKDASHILESYVRMRDMEGLQGSIGKGFEFHFRKALLAQCTCGDFVKDAQEWYFYSSWM